MLKSIKNALAIKDESSMWDNFNSVFLKSETYALKETGSMKDDIYACVNYDDVCVIMMDSSANATELADEEAFGIEYPLYFTESSH